MSLQTMSWLMLWLVVMITTRVAATDDVASRQLVTFMEKTSGPVGVIRTSTGMKVDNITAKTTLNKRLIHNCYFMETITHLVRQKTLERVVHGKGAGAFGYFEVTRDLSDICKAKVFSKVGKKTQVAVRFSSQSPGLSGVDTIREARGFAVKFYTEDGNLDIVGFNTPMMLLNDAIKLPMAVRVINKNPKTNTQDINMLWDYITVNPESLNFFLIVFSDRGIPYGFQYMPGFGIHTFQVVNENGDIYFVRFHFNPDAGIRNLASDVAARVGAADPDFTTRVLYNAIETGDYPSWSVGVQVLSMEDVKNAGFNVFDIAKVLPLEKYPLRMFGRMVLNRNPSNYFAEVEQMAFSPGNLVPGILGGPDKVFEARILAYRDAHNHRLGANVNKIKVNQPIMKPLTYNRNGVPPLDDNGADIPNYYPNSFHGPEAYIEKNKVDIIDIHEEPGDNFNEISEMYVNGFTDDERDRLITNLVNSLGTVTPMIQDRAVNIFKKINCDLGRRVSEGLKNYTADNETIPYI